MYLPKCGGTENGGKEMDWRSEEWHDWKGDEWFDDESQERM